MKYSVLCVVLYVVLTPCWAAHEVICKTGETPAQRHYGRLIAWRASEAVLAPNKEVLINVLAILFHRTEVEQNVIRENSVVKVDKIILVTGDVLFGCVIEIDATHIVFTIDGHREPLAVLRQRVEMVVFAQKGF